MGRVSEAPLPPVLPVPACFCDTVPAWGWGQNHISPLPTPMVETLAMAPGPASLCCALSLAALRGQLPVWAHEVVCCQPLIMYSRPWPVPFPRGH